MSKKGRDRTKEKKDRTDKEEKKWKIWDKKIIWNSVGLDGEKWFEINQYLRYRNY